MKNFLLVILVIIVTLLSGCGIKTERTEVTEVTEVTETETTVIETEAATAEPAVTEPLKLTLDEFGSLVQYTDRFAIAGTILDESLFEGQIVVGNAFAIHDNGFVSQEGNVVFYYISPVGGGRVRMTGFDGQFFVIDKGIMTVDQAIKAMTETLERAHGATPETIQIHELVRYGDPVK